MNTIKQNNMDELELLISSNREEFNNGKMPDGHQERFSARLQRAEQAHRQKSRLSGWLSKRWGLLTTVAAAAAILICLGISFNHSSLHEQERLNSVVAEQHNIVDELAAKLLNECASNSLMQQETEAFLQSLTQEASTIEQLLPDEMSAKKRIEVIKEYYKERADAIMKFRTMLTEDINNY